MRLGFLGLGLIGGSIARAVRQSEGGQAISISAWTPTGRGPEEARAAGVVDEVAPTAGAAVAGADLVVLAAPPQACLELIRQLGDGLRDALEPGATVTDVASTKRSLLEAARAAGLPYVGGHPMAGRETAGFGAADAGLFAARPWVITEPVGGGDPAAVEALARRCGARVLHLAADEHDGLVAAVSHLPLVTAVMLVEAVVGTTSPRDDWAAAATLAATGWRDMTRLARGDPAMGAGIAVTNSPAIAARLRVLRERLDEWLALLEAPDGPKVEDVQARLALAARRLEMAPAIEAAGSDRAIPGAAPAGSPAGPGIAAGHPGSDERPVT